MQTAKTLISVGIKGFAMHSMVSRSVLVSSCGQRNSDQTGLEVIKLKYSLRLKIKRNDWLLADTCPQAANHCALF